MKKKKIAISFRAYVSIISVVSAWYYASSLQNILPKARKFLMHYLGDWHA